MTEDRITKLLSTISEKNVFQKKVLTGWTAKMSQGEKEGLDALISFYETNGDTVPYLAECYLNIVEMFMEERIYFVKNGRYRYSGIEDVNKFFDQNPGFMEHYMKGLAISQYLIEQHKKCREFFCDTVSALDAGENWLEVGVGHGEYFTLALQHTNYKNYLGIDISPTSVQLTKEMVAQRSSPRANLKSVEVREQDFFQYSGPICDALVMGEILEHVEKPTDFLNKAYEITHEKSFIYITTVVNAPAIDHVYLFSNVGEIEELYRRAGFEICDKRLCPAHGYTLDKAVKMKAEIITAHVLKKI